MGGLRNRELESLTWDGVDFDEGNDQRYSEAGILAEDLGRPHH
jgi:hypothetical protein